jgi:GMP synthase (glutamine-hydrolysing)
MKKLFIIKAGSTFAETSARVGDFDAMALRGMAFPAERTQVVLADQGAPLPAASDCLGVVITGAHCMVTDNLPWSLAIERWLPGLIDAEVPILGICYGHQLLGRALGGIVEDHPAGKEVGTFEIQLTPAKADDPLFCRLPERFPVHATHTQSVTTLPPGAILLAGNDFEPHHAMRIGNNAWGVQFHPEYDSSITRDYINAQAKALTRAGQDVAALLDGVVETPEAASILKRFGEIALGNV